VVNWPIIWWLVVPEIFVPKIIKIGRHFFDWRSIMFGMFFSGHGVKWSKLRNAGLLQSMLSLFCSDLSETDSSAKRHTWYYYDGSTIMSCCSIFILFFFVSAVCVYSGTYAAFSDRSVSDQPFLLGVARLLLTLLHWLRGSVCLPGPPDCWFRHSVARSLWSWCACWCSRHGSLLGIVLRLLTQHRKTRP